MKKLSDNQKKVIQYMQAGYGLRLHLLTTAYQPNLFKDDHQVHISMQTVTSLLDRQLITHTKSENPAHHCYKLTDQGKEIAMPPLPPVRKYRDTDKVLAGFQKLQMVVVSAELCLTGWRYRLAFPKKDGTPHKSREHRLFFEKDIKPM